MKLYHAHTFSHLLCMFLYVVVKAIRSFCIKLVVAIYCCESAVYVSLPQTEEVRIETFHNRISHDQLMLKQIAVTSIMTGPTVTNTIGSWASRFSQFGAGAGEIHELHSLHVTLQVRAFLSDTNQIRETPVVFLPPPHQTEKCDWPASLDSIVSVTVSPVMIEVTAICLSIIR